MGESEETILRQVRDRNGPVPDRITNAPELQMGMEFTYSAFQRLSTSRQLGMGSGPIPWIAIAEFCDRHGLDEDEQSDLEYLIGKMDEVYLKHLSDKAAQKQEYDRSAAESRRSLNGKLKDRRG